MNQNWHINGNPRGNVGTAYKKYGIGAQIMKKMGYIEGQGLGKYGQGRLEPVTTHLRPKGMGLGAIREISKEDKDPEHAYKKVTFEVQKLPTLFSLIDSLETAGFEVPMKIKLLSDETDQDDPKACWDLRLSLEDVLSKVRAINVKRKYLETELNQRKSIYENSMSQIKVLETLRANEGNFETLKEEQVPEDSKKMVAQMMVSILNPKVVNIVNSWDIKSFDETTEMVKQLTTWKRKVDVYDESAFDNMFVQLWFPKASAFFRNEWISIDQPNLGVSIIDEFVSDGLVPKAAMNYFLKSVIVPILDNDIKVEWKIDPRSKLKGPETWLVDWLDILPDVLIDTLMESLFNRYKDWILASWNSTEFVKCPSKEIGLNLWVDYYSTPENKMQQKIEEAMVESQLCKLRHEVKFTYDAMVQDALICQKFMKVMAVNGIDRSFINKALEKIIVLWLRSFKSMDVHASGFRYLCCWTTVFFYKNMDLPSIKMGLWDACGHLNRRLNTGLDVQSQRIESLVKQMDDVHIEEPSPNKVPVVTIKMLVTEYCKKNNLFLIPITNRSFNEEGKILFKITADMKKGLDVYFENNIVWARLDSNSNFEPIAIDEISTLLSKSI